MRSFKTTWQALALSAAVAVTSATPLLAQHISTDYNHSTNFADYHTFSFGQVHASDQLYEQRIKDQVTKDLTAHGWQMVPTGGAVTVNAIGGMHDQQDYTTFYDGLGGFGWRRGWGGGGFGQSYTTVNQVPIGTLVVDLYETDNHQLLFRGMASDQLSNNNEKNTGKLDKAIDKIFNKFPKSAM